MTSPLPSQIRSTPGEPASVRIGTVVSVSPLSVSVQGTVFTGVGSAGSWSPVAGQTVALLGQSAEPSSDPASWMVLGSVESNPAGHQAGEEPITFVTQTSATLAVVFARPFAAVPNVHTNINSGAGATALWQSRAINITTAGFTIFVYTTGAAASWTNVPVGWSAFPVTQ